MIAPGQGKKVKDHVLKQALKDYTFQPEISRSTSVLAKRRKEKEYNEIGKNVKNKILQSIASKEVDKPVELQDRYYLGMLKN
jgi:gas vesicle protein